MESYSQASQDLFYMKALKYKNNGYFLEIGSNDPIKHNNTYLAESRYGWKGIMVEYDTQFLQLYKEHRPNSIHIINDATKIDYKDLFIKNNVQSTLDFLQIDLEAETGSTLETLLKLDKEIFDDYKFATITFEHDVYRTSQNNITRSMSREIFNKRGYVCVFTDINNCGINPYEDWYVHPDLVDMNYVNTLIKNNNKYYVENPITKKTINWQDIKY